MKTEGLKYFIESKKHWVGFCSLLFLFSCKNSGPEIISSSSQSQSKTAIYGVITINKSVLLDDGSISAPTGELSALFSASPLIADNLIGATSLNVGDVSINNTQLTRGVKEGTTYYETTLSKFAPGPYLCNVSGFDNVKPFSHTVDGNFPDYLGYSLLPDTINSKSILLINLADITNADEVDVYLSDLANSTTIKHANAQTKTVSFSVHDLSNLSVPASAVVVLTCYKSFYETFNGKKYKFRLGYKVVKFNVAVI